MLMLMLCNSSYARLTPEVLHYSTPKSRKRAYEAGTSQSKAPIAVRPQFYPPAFICT